MDELKPITNNNKMQMRHWPSIREANAKVRMPSMDLEPNLYVTTDNTGYHWFELSKINDPTIYFLGGSFVLVLIYFTGNNVSILCDVIFLLVY